jgi:hypothetical protein
VIDPLSEAANTVVHLHCNEAVMGASIDYMEHRWGTRIVLDAPAELKSGDGLSAIGSVRNASLSGAFVETRARLPLLARVSLRPLNAGAEWLDACVVRVESRGVALEWLEPGLQAVATLLAMRPGAWVGEDHTPHAVHRNSVAWVLQERMHPGYAAVDAAS